jgi:membrane-associated phospholipid phosphatase
VAKNSRKKEVGVAQKTTAKRQIPDGVSYGLIATGLSLGLIIFSLSYLGMKYGYLLGTLNQPLLDWMISIRTPILTAPMKILTVFADPVVLAPLIGIIAIVWVFIKREFWRPAILVGSTALALFISTAIKIITMDPRPAKINMVPAFETNYSFPSGHTIAIATLLLILGYLIYSRNFNKKSFTVWIGVAVFGTILIALSRLYLGYHWLTDVLASIGLAMIILATVVSVDLLACTKKFVDKLQD